MPYQRLGRALNPPPALDASDSGLRLDEKMYQPSPVAVYNVQHDDSE